MKKNIYWKVLTLLFVTINLSKFIDKESSIIQKELKEIYNFKNAEIKFSFNL